MKPKKKNTGKILMKFGGTSVGSPEGVRRLITIVSSSKEPVAGVVVSAFAKITNQLIQAATLASNGDKSYNNIFLEIADRHIGVVHELIVDDQLREKTLKEVELILTDLESALQGVFLLKESSPKVLDAIMSYGERLSATIITQCFINNDVKAEFVDARELIKTDASFGEAHVQIETTYEIVKNYFQKAKNLKVITGFVGSTDKGETTTLGRRGSDYTASLIGAAIKAARIEIWADTDGVTTADPIKVPNAFPVPHLTYQEAMEMSHFGTKVIYPLIISPAFTNSIPLVIRNTFNASFPGTTISSRVWHNYSIKGISSIEEVSIFLMQGSSMRGTFGVRARLFEALASHKINIIFITQASSEYTICFAIDPKDTEKAKAAFEEEFKHEIKDGFIDPVSVEKKFSIIAVIGEQMRKSVGIAGKLFTTLAAASVNVVAIAQGSSERNISFVVAKKDEITALQAIHKAFFEQ